MKVAWQHALSCIPQTAILSKSESNKEFVLLNGSTFQFWSLDEPDNVLGWGYDIAVLDEGARISKYARDEIVAPMLADRNGAMLVITTPKGQKGRGGWVWRDYKKAQQRAPGYYKMTGPSTQNPLASIREWASWAKTNLPDSVYRQEILAEFLESGTTVFDLTPICVNGGDEDHPIRLPFHESPLVEGPPIHPYPKEAAPPSADGDKSHVERCALGVDLAQTQNYTVITAIGLESGRLRTMQRFNKISWEVQVERIKKAKEQYYGPMSVDTTGIGGPIREMLRRKSVGFTAVTFTTEEKQTLIQGLQVAIEQRELSMPWIAEAVSEGETFEADVLSSGRMKYGAAQGFHDDIIISLALAVRAAKRRITGVVQ